MGSSLRECFEGLSAIDYHALKVSSAQHATLQPPVIAALTSCCMPLCTADLIELMSTSSSTLIISISNSTAEEMEGKRGGQTVSSRFTGQLKDLVSMLDATGLHFVRCIKPNSALTAGNFTSDLVLQQLRCCGVLEVARVSRAGYPTRYRHADFVQRYKIMLPCDQQNLALHNEAEARAAVMQLLSVFKVPQGQYEMGKTKVFFKPGKSSAWESTAAVVYYMPACKVCSVQPCDAQAEWFLLSFTCTGLSLHCTVASAAASTLCHVPSKGWWCAAVSAHHTLHNMSSLLARQVCWVMLRTCGPRCSPVRSSCRPTRACTLHKNSIVV